MQINIDLNSELFDFNLAKYTELANDVPLAQELNVGVLSESKHRYK